MNIIHCITLRSLPVLLLLIVATVSCKQYSDRYFVTHVPASYTGKKAAPLVVVLHGYSLTADSMQDFCGFDELADKHGFITVYPEGTFTIEGKHGWLSGGWFSKNLFVDKKLDDVAFLSWLVDKLKKDYNIDGKRIFFVGYSNGGFMANRMAGARPDIVAAIATFGAGTSAVGSDILSAVPVMIVRGDDDDIVSAASVKYARDMWREKNQCGDALVVFSNTYVTETLWRGDSANDVVYALIKDQGHGWPVPENLDSYDMPARMWSFFQSHSKNNL